MHHFATFELASVRLDRALAICMTLDDPIRVPDRYEFLALRFWPIAGTQAIKNGPAAMHNSGPKSSRRSGAAPTQPRRLRAVIVEDEPIVAMNLEMLLEDLDADVVGIAMCAADACALVQTHKPDFVTMDINLKGDRDGVSAAIEIFKTYGVRSIFISSYSDLATQKRAEPCRAIAWIKKPIDTADLSDALNLVVRRGG